MAALRQLEAGIPIDDSAITRQHPDLMPELAQQLKDARTLLAAKQRADRERLSGLPVDPREEMLEEELETLRRALKRYEIFERVRYGGQGVVYRGRQRGTKRIVALKVLLDGSLATERQRYRFEREVELVSRLRHPNVVTVFESGTVRGRLYYAMEFVEGRPIDHYVALKDLNPHEIVRLIVKVCRAVACAHQNGVIHRDLNPSNILVDEQDEPRVFDFGLAKDAWATGDDARFSCTGLVVGTLPYLSPEQAGGLDGKADVRSDVYALGVVLYELLTDRLPYPVDDDPATIRQAIISMDPVPLRKAARAGGEDVPGAGLLNRDLEMVLAKALAKAKDERYQSAGDLADDLERYLTGEAVQARAGHALYVLRKTLRRYRWPAGIAALFLGVLATSWLQIRAERDIARGAVGVAYRLFDTALTYIEESVRPLAGGVAVRDRLIEHLAGELPELQQLVESDETLEPVLTRLLEKRGDIAYEQGHRAEASACYRAFLDRTQEFSSAGPTHLGGIADVVRAHRKLAGVSDGATSLFERGIELGEEAFGQGQDSPGTRYELCQLHQAFGDVLRNSGHYDRALAEYERVLELRLNADEDDPTNIRWLRVSAKALSGQGLVLQKLGDGARSMDAIEHGLKLRQQILLTSPSDTEARYGLLLSYRHLGILKRDAGEEDKAKRLLQKARDHGTFLAEMDPTATTWDRDRYWVLDHLTVLCLDTGELNEAREYCEEAVSLAARLYDPQRQGSGDSAEIFARALILQGRVQMSEDLCRKAHQAFEHAASICERLVASDRENEERLKQLASVHYWLGACVRKLGRTRQALPHYERLCEIYAELRRLRPDAVDTALDLVAAQISLAAAYLRLDSVEANQKATLLLDQAEQALEGLKEAGKLRGLERPYSRRVDAIRANRRIVQQKRAQRAATRAIEPP